MITIILLISLLLIVLYFNQLRKESLTTKTMMLVSLASSLSFVLYLIQFIKYPQGGGISLFSMLPVLIVSIVYGPTLGVTSGLIFGILKLLNGATIVHPAQFLLDYLLSAMALGLVGYFKSSNLLKLGVGLFVAISASVFINILSGAVFFAQYAPEGMNAWLYSSIYNLSSAGVEGILTFILILTPPLQRVISELKSKQFIR